MNDSRGDIVVTAFYRFVNFPDFQEFRQPLLTLMHKHGVRGTVLLAAEGINGTIAGSRSGIDAVLDWLGRDERFQGLEGKESCSDDNPFYRTKVKLKREIVTMGVEGIDPRNLAGSYVAPTDWNRLLDDPEVVLIDTRNDYEVKIGSFKTAINPGTDTFRDFPKFVASELDPKRHKRVAMFCTGGIRCEKSTAYLKQQGFEEVYHLKGGILSYLEQVPRAESKWQGECFVFDNRVTVDHDLKPGRYDQCHACRMPISEQDMCRDSYQKGVSCPFCYGKLGKEKLEQLEERERQIDLALRRGEKHIGDPVQSTIARRRRRKLRFKNEQRQRSSVGSTQAR